MQRQWVAPLVGACMEEFSGYMFLNGDDLGSIVTLEKLLESHVIRVLSHWKAWLVVFIPGITCCFSFDSPYIVCMALQVGTKACITLIMPRKHSSWADVHGGWHVSYRKKSKAVKWHTLLKWQWGHYLYNLHQTEDIFIVLLKDFSILCYVIVYTCNSVTY